ncbi:MAG: NIL domain-containing protein [Chlamydiota bacterium]|nr:NIL domain-containing protein [Chlamydiota bacterium]
MRYYLTYPQDLIKKPILYELGHKFNIVTNIRTASVDAGVGLIGLEITGDPDEIERAVAWLRESGVNVESIHQDVVES